MSKKQLIIALLILILLPIFSVNAAPPRGLAINQELKQCQFYDPSAMFVLPGGWQDYGSGSIPFSNFKSECEKLGYTYINSPLKMKTNPVYLFVIYNPILIILFLITLINFIKTKKVKYIKYAIILVLIYLISYVLIEYSYSY